jgi:hypothetical protein
MGRRPRGTQSPKDALNQPDQRFGHRSHDLENVGGQPEWNAKEKRKKLDCCWTEGWGKCNQRIMNCGVLHNARPHNLLLILSNDFGNGMMLSNRLSPNSHQKLRLSPGLGSIMLFRLVRFSLNLRKRKEVSLFWDGEILGYQSFLGWRARALIDFIRCNNSSG